jgi:hypothetical protein
MSAGMTPNLHWRVYQSASESSSEAPTRQNQSDEKPEPVNDSFELDIKRPVHETLFN